MNALGKLAAFAWIGCVTQLAQAAEPSAPEPSPAPAAQRAPAQVSVRSVAKLAAERSPEVAIGRATVTASRSGMLGGRLTPLGNPQIEVTAQKGAQGVTKDVAIDAALWVPVEIGGQNSGRATEANDFVALNEALLAQARAHAMGEAVRAYGSLEVAERRYEVVLDIVKDAKREAEVYQARLAAGDTIVRDAAMVSVEVARHEVLLAEIRGDLVRHKNELLRLTGQEVGSVPMSEPIPADFSPTNYSEGAIDRSPQVQVGRAVAKFYGSSKERYRREGRTPLAFGLIGGRGDQGEARLGGGLSYTLPVFRSNQVEQARAEAERTRALAEVSVRREVLRAQVASGKNELHEMRAALQILTDQALPAAERALAAADATYRAGKGDWLAVLLSRRELSTLLLKRLDLTAKGWLILGELVEITGELP
jgi:cobalt-zinc-cadmium efflux system outer membrane protein